MEPKFQTRKEAKEAGFFSRRHKTGEAHVAAKAAREERAKRKAERAQSSETRSVAEQIARLNSGGHAAKKERKRLTE